MMAVAVGMPEPRYRSGIAAVGLIIAGGSLVIGGLVVDDAMGAIVWAASAMLVYFAGVVAGSTRVVEHVGTR